MKNNFYINKKQNNKSENSINEKYRYYFIIGFIVIAFIYLTYGLYNIQIKNSEDYTHSLENAITTVVPLRGNRGMITDSNAVIFAQSVEVYDVTFYRDASQNSKEEYKDFTNAIAQTVEIIEKHGNELSVSFVIKRNEDTNEWQFDFGSGVSEATLQTRENQWRNNNYFSVASVPTATVAMEKLISRYQIPEDMDEEMMLKVLAVYSEMQMNLFNSQPIVIAEDVPYETVIEIETRSMLLPGMEISIGSERVYPQGSLAAQVIGYMGAISSASKWEELSVQGYQYSDQIGVDGIESSMESWLTQNSDAKQGYSIVERDRVGKITREIENVKPEDGNNVKLTLIASYQQQAERALAENVLNIRASEEKKLMDPSWLDNNKIDIENRNWEKYPISLANRAAMMVVDMQGQVRAMANYPSYDLNALTAKGKESTEILMDTRNLLMNYNIHSRATPGSIFKMVPSLAALMEGELMPDEVISDGGYFMLYNTDQSTAPKCWISEAGRSSHQYLTIVGGLSNSCNFFFYTLGHRLGEMRLYEYAADLGLTSKTGVELPGEQRSVVGNQVSLYNPDLSMDEAAQDTSIPIIVFNSIKSHLRNQAASYNITYDDERLERCVKRLMDMAVNISQTEWLTQMRIVLMEELNMTREMVYTQAIIGDTYNYLNDIKWGGSQTIQVAIGQSITTLTPAAVSRYIAAIGNGGTVYNLTLIDSITSPEGNIVSQKVPTIHHVFEGADSAIELIIEGMAGVVDESGTADKHFSGWEYRYNVAAKTGTAEVTAIDLENNGWFVMLAPFGVNEETGVAYEPEIAVVVYIPSGFSGGETGLAAKLFVDWYMKQKELRNQEVIFPSANSLAP